MVSPENNSNWLFDYCLPENITFPDGDLPAFESGFHWSSTALPDSSGLSVEFVDSLGTSDGVKEASSRKRFQELSYVLEPGRPPKMDKAVILRDAVQMVTQLRDEAEKLKESHKNL